MDGATPPGSGCNYVIYRGFAPTAIHILPLWGRRAAAHRATLRRSRDGNARGALSGGGWGGECFAHKVFGWFLILSFFLIVIVTSVNPASSSRRWNSNLKQRSQRHQHSPANRAALPDRNPLRSARRACELRDPMKPARTISNRATARKSRPRAQAGNQSAVTYRR